MSPCKGGGRVSAGVEEGQHRGGGRVSAGMKGEEQGLFPVRNFQPSPQIHEWETDVKDRSMSRKAFGDIIEKFEKFCKIHNNLFIPGEVTCGQLPALSPLGTNSMFSGNTMMDTDLP